MQVRIKGVSGENNREQQEEPEFYAPKLLFYRETQARLVTFR